MKIASRHKRFPKHNIGAHFLTAKTYRNTPYFAEPTCALIFCEELESARQRYGSHVLAFVVMPGHVHLLLWWNTEALPNLAISRIAWAVKGLSARRIVDYLKGQGRVGKGSAPAYPGEAPSNPVLHPARDPGAVSDLATRSRI